MTETGIACYDDDGTPLDITVYVEKLTEPGYSLTPSSYTLNGSGYTDIPCTFDSLQMGWINYNNDFIETDEITFHMQGGTLTNGDGYSISFDVDNAAHTNHEYDEVSCGGNYSSPNDTVIMSVYIDPDEYDSAMPGTYTGTVQYWGIWRKDGTDTIEDEIRSIALTLTVPDPTPVYTVTLDPGEGQGTPITFRSSDQAEIPHWHESSSGQFYHEDDGYLFLNWTSLGGKE